MDRSSPRARPQPRRAQRADGRLDTSKENWNQATGRVRWLCTWPEGMIITGTHGRPERPRSVPNRWLCRPGFGCVMRSAKAGVMNAIKASSGRGPDLAVKQRSRDDASRGAEALADVQRSSIVEHGGSGLDTSGSAPLPRSSNCDATTEAPWGFTRVVIAADSGSGSRGCLTRAFVEILERKHPGTRWYVDGVETRRAAEPSPR